MGLEVEDVILRETGGACCREVSVLQSLWSGYGSILRYEVEGADHSSVIIKHISPPTSAQHPRGWNTDRSHQRKLKSYKVESLWYQHYAPLCDERCRVPSCIAVERDGEEVIILLEDLKEAGFREQDGAVRHVEIHACLKWLAEFHATFLGCSTEGLWECGTYWHLETRPDELECLRRQDPALFQAADVIDRKLRESPYQCLVHGDAKLANFLFSSDGSSVAAVDFQYVGGGCGMKDVAYFIGSCFREEDCENYAPALLDFYFQSLRKALARRGGEVHFKALEEDWRSLYPVAWTDFHRFLKGWSPGHWKIHSYSERLAKGVLAVLEEDPRGDTEKDF